jgi:hypothetical protein
VLGPIGSLPTLKTVQTDNKFDVLTNDTSIDFEMYASNAITIIGSEFTNVVGAQKVGSDFIRVDANSVVSYTTNNKLSVLAPANTEVEMLANKDFRLQAPYSLTMCSWVNNLTKKYENQRGGKVYELTNHLGNVMSVVTDRKTCATGPLISADYFNQIPCKNVWLS